MKKFFNIVYCLSAAVALSACTTVTEYALRGFVDGNKTCQPAEMLKINRNLMARNTVKIGEHQSYVTSTDFLGQPDKTATFYMESGSQVEALFYKTSSLTCDTGYMSKHDYFPIFTVEEHVVGMGHDFYERGIKPFLAQKKSRIKVLAFNKH